VDDSVYLRLAPVMFLCSPSIVYVVEQQKYILEMIERAQMDLWQRTIEEINYSCIQQGEFHDAYRLSQYIHSYGGRSYQDSMYIPLQCTLCGEYTLNLAFRKYFTCLEALLLNQTTPINCSVLNTFKHIDDVTESCSDHRWRYTQYPLVHSL